MVALYLNTAVPLRRFNAFSGIRDSLGRWGVMGLGISGSDSLGRDSIHRAVQAPTSLGYLAALAVACLRLRSSAWARPPHTP